jgi:hypothetical protein
VDDKRTFGVNKLVILDGKKESPNLSESIRKMTTLIDRLEINQSLDRSEIYSLKAEFKLVQDFINVNFELLSTAVQTQKQLIQKSLLNIISKYYPNNTSKFEISFIGEDVSSIDIAALNHLLDSVVKIMSEEQIKIAKFRLKFSLKGLSLITQYQLNDKSILPSRNDISLLNILSKAKAAGGTFECGKHNEIWVNHLFFPYALTKNESSRKAA